MDPDKAYLLGSPLGDVPEIDALIAILGSRFWHLSYHNSLTLLRHSFSVPKLQYLLYVLPHPM